MKYWVLRWSPAVVIMAIIFIASSTSGSSIPDFGALSFIILKGGHLFGYALLGLALIYGLTNGRPITRSRVLFIVILVILYAISDEWHQSFTPGRTPSPIDIAIDTTGSLIGMACFYSFKKGRLKPKSRNAG